MRRWSRILIALVFFCSLAVGSGAWGAQATTVGRPHQSATLPPLSTLNADAITGNPNAVVVTPQNASTVLRGTPLAAIATNGSWGNIRNRNSTKCLDAADDSAGNPNQNGDYVQIWTCNGRSNQGWGLQLLSGALAGWFRIVNEYGNHLVLDAEFDQYDNPWSNGDRVQMWTWNGGCQQIWTLAVVPNTNYAWLYNYCSGKVLDAENDLFNNPNNNGDYIQLWTQLGVKQWNQQWS